MAKLSEDAVTLLRYAATNAPMSLNVFADEHGWPVARAEAACAELHDAGYIERHAHKDTGLN